MVFDADALEYRRRHHGPIGVESKVSVKGRPTLSLVYTLGKSLTLKEEALDLHRRFRGKLQVVSKVPRRNCAQIISIPYMLDFRVPVAVAKAVATAAMQSGVARLYVDPEVMAEIARSFIYEGKLGLVA